MSKFEKGTKERRKARKVVARIRNRRHNFVHQEARKIVNRFEVIAVEKLNVKGMAKNHCLAKSIFTVPVKPHAAAEQVSYPPT